MRIPRYTLRTLLFLVAIICVACAFVASQRRIISDRQAFIKKVWPNGCWLTQEDALHSGVVSNNGIPIIRSILGDEAYFGISIEASAPQSLIEEACRLFPEASIVRVFGNEEEQVYPNPNSQN